MNYRHEYHAGNFADVIKHVILTALISSLTKKANPFCYLDTHAGAGFYDLSADTTAKTKEYEQGIEKIIQAENPPLLVKRYLDCVHEINNKLSHAKFASLTYYPGSPMIAKLLMRPTDRIIACELHPEAYRALKNAFGGDKQVAIHHMDGFLGLKAHLPPPMRRGLILIDPPYENPDEFSHIARNLAAAMKRFETGVYAIWYPLKEKRQVERFYRTVKQTIPHPTLAIELTIYPDLPNHLNGCGLIVINPPWQFHEMINEILPWLWKALTINQQGGFNSYFLK